jgi:hypothetical protein
MRRGLRLIGELEPVTMHILHAVAHLLPSCCAPDVRQTQASGDDL